MQESRATPVESSAHSSAPSGESTAANLAGLLALLEAGSDLSRDQADAIMEELLGGRLTHADIVRLLAAMRAKGESIDELVGFARAMRRQVIFAAKLALPGTLPREPLVDTCGTGGDGGGTFNVSTAAAIVVAGAGVRVAKHGNRSFSSRCGSADVLEALGVKIDVPAERAFAAVQEVGMGFLFAPAMHTAMRHAVAARREVGRRTVFNLLGPLTNPAGANVQVIGVPTPALVSKLGHALAELGGLRAFVVHGTDGIDEISLSAETEVADVRPHDVKRYRISPADFGVQSVPREVLVGGDAATNAAIIRRILEGERGPRRDFVCINAAAALVAAGRAESCAAGARLAAEAIDSGAALAKLNTLIDFSRS